MLLYFKNVLPRVEQIFYYIVGNTSENIFIILIKESSYPLVKLEITFLIRVHSTGKKENGIIGDKIFNVTKMYHLKVFALFKVVHV